MAWYRWQGDTLELLLRVQPCAREDAFGEPLGDALRVRIKAPPVDGKANARLVSFLAGAFGVPKQRVHIARGTQGRSKLVRIDAPVVLPVPLAEGSTGSRDSA